MSERETLVERFDDLRPGMLVVLKQCDQCNTSHRGILGRLAWVDGAPGYLHWPAPKCTSPVSRFGTRLIGPRAVEIRKVYRIETGLESVIDTNETIHMERVAAAFREFAEGMKKYRMKK